MQNVNKNIPQNIPCANCGKSSDVIPMIVDGGDSQIIPVVCRNCDFVSCLEEIEPGLFANRTMIAYEAYDTIAALSKWLLEAAKEELKAMEKPIKRKSTRWN